jgi:localization factor PodJL
VGRDAREAAEEAARRSGMSLGEWLDDVIVERAAEQGVNPEDFNSEDRLDAIADRLSNLAHRDDAPARRNQQETEPETEQEDTPVHRLVSREEARRAEDLLEAAITRFEARAAKSEERTARALDSVAEWIEKSRNAEHEEKRTSESLAERLEAIESRISKRQSEAVGRASDALAERLNAIETQIAKRNETEASQRSPERIEGALNAMKQVESAARDLDKRMADLARRMDETERPRATTRPRIDLAEAVSQIARRRQALDSKAPAPPPAAAEPPKPGPSGGWRNFGVDASPPPPRPSAPPAPPPAPPKDNTANDLQTEFQRSNKRPDDVRREQSEKRAAPDTDLGGVRAELQRLHQRLDELRREQSEKRPAPGADLAALRAELQPLNQRLDELRREQSEKREAQGADIVTLRAELHPLHQRLDELRREQSEKRTGPTADLAALRAELSPLNQRLDELRREHSEKRAAPDAEFAALRAELSGMSSALAGLAPRNAVIAIEGAVRDLSDRVASLRDQNLREFLVKPVDEIVADIRETLHANDPRKAVANLEHDIGAIRDRLDALARTRVDPDVLERIRQQTEEVRGMLSAAAQRPMPVDRLERQIGELADRVDHLASSRSPHVDSAQVVASLANARAEIERSTPALALNVIERRLEDIASKIDQAISRSQSSTSIGAKAVEELARRIDSVRETIETRHPLPIVSASLEATMRDLTTKLQDAQPQRFDTEPLEAWMREVSEKLDTARTVSVDTAHFENSMRDLAAKLNEAQPPAFDSAPLEAWMREVSEKLESANASAAGFNARQLETFMREVGEKLESANAAGLQTQQLEAWMRDLSDKLERASAEGLNARQLEAWMGEVTDKLEKVNAAGLNGRLLETWMREVSEKLESARPIALDTRPLEAWMREVSEKLERPGAAGLNIRQLEDLIREVNDKLDASRPAPLDAGHFESTIRDLAAKFEDAQTGGFDKEPLEAWMREVSEKLETARPIALDTKPLEGWMRELTAKLDNVKPGSIDTKSLEDTLRSIDIKLSQAASPRFESSLVDQTAQALAREIEARIKPSGDIRAIEGLIRNLEDKLGRVGGDAAPENLGALRDQVGQLSSRLDEMRDSLRAAQAAMTDQGDRGGLSAGDLESLRAAQEASERRVQTTLGGVHGLLEKLVDRLARIEEDAARTNRSPIDEPRAATPPAPPPANAVDDFESALPKKAAATPPPIVSPVERAPARAPVAPPRISESPDFLIEPGSGAPAAVLGKETPGVPPKAAVNAHIAAARRAAQAAMAEAPNEGGAAAKNVAAATEGPAAAGHPIAQARAFINARRRPILLGLAFVILGAIAVIELGTMYVVKTQKSDVTISAPAKATSEASPTADTPPKSDVAQKSDARALDTTPTGSIVPSPQADPEAALPVEHKPPVPAPADLVALIPPATPKALRDLAASGDPAAEFELASRLFDGHGVPRDMHEASQWFERAALQDFAPAQYRMGACFDKGNGVERDLAAAKVWYQKAANAGNIRAMHNLAVLLAEGPGMKPDYAEASAWFQKAAQYGVKDSQYNLAILYARGMGVPLDLNQSWLWFSLAAQQGDTDAAKKRDDVATKLDANALAADAAALAAFKVRQANPAANDVKAPDGGWDSKGPTQANEAPSKPPHPSTAL